MSAAAESRRVSGESFPTAPPVKVSPPLWYVSARLPAATALALLRCQRGANGCLKHDSADCGSDLFLYG